MYLEIFLADFAVFRVSLGILRVRDRVKYQKPCKYHIQIMLLFVYTTTRKRFVILTCRYFKLS